MAAAKETATDKATAAAIEETAPVEPGTAATVDAQPAAVEVAQTDVTSPAGPGLVAHELPGGNPLVVSTADGVTTTFVPNIVQFVGDGMQDILAAQIADAGGATSSAQGE